MIRLITLLMVLVVNAVTAQTQYQTGMQKALTLWGENKPTEASALFERIATAEKNNWLPSYYVALVNTTEAFKTKDKDMINALLTKAQAAQDNATTIAPDNAELLVMQAMINTAWIVYDPMTNGMKLSAKTNELYDKAMVIAPKNPRVVFCKAEFEIGAAAYFNMDTKPMCDEVERAIGLFATFKPESVFHPNWGLDRAQNALKNCKK